MKSARRQSSAKPTSKKQLLNSNNTKNSTKPSIKKVYCSIPIKMTSTTSRSAALNSYRGRNSKPEIIKNSEILTSLHSRKLSIQQPSTARQPMSAWNRSKQKSKEKTPGLKKQHIRSNSTLSRKQSKVIKQSSFKIDLSKIGEKKITFDNHQNEQKKSGRKEMGRNDFEFDFVIGKGGFGKVWSVYMKKTKAPLAMKEMNKAKIIAKRSIHSVLNERILLAKLKHPFLVNMSFAFQDRQKLYLAMDLLTGGDLRYHMGCRDFFEQNEAKFFLACIILGLEYLHNNKIIHRDIKPENLVFDDKGYLRVTDLGIARLQKENNSSDTSGTPGYMAPEVMCRQDHSFAVDYYAVGVIAYQLMLGFRPYNGRNRKEIRDSILSKQVQVKLEEVPPGWSTEAAHFINKMIQRKPNNRLGNENGIKQIKESGWFKSFPWEKLLKKQIKAPFIPKNVMGTEDYRAQISQTSQDEVEQQNLLLLRKEEVQEAFAQYEYFARETKTGGTSTNTSTRLNKKTTKNSANTANTYGSFTEDKEQIKQSARNLRKKSNYLKI